MQISSSDRRSVTSSDAAQSSAGALDRDGATPLYVQLSTILRDKINRGEWKPGTKIPSENELNQVYGISRMTARQVLLQLVNEGLLFRVQGKGTFVAPRKIQAQSPVYQGIREQLEELGYKTSTKLLSAQVREPDSKIAEVLRLPRGERVYVLRRLRSVDRGPISLHVSYVPERLAPGLDSTDLVGRQLCSILDTEYGLRMSQINETLESTSARGQDAKDLQVSQSTPLLLLIHEIADATGLYFEFSRILFRGDKIRLSFQYKL